MESHTIKDKVSPFYSDGLFMSTGIFIRRGIMKSKKKKKLLKEIKNFRKEGASLIFVIPVENSNLIQLIGYFYMRSELKN